jgi:5'-phosphate synthase pdxT subunit
MRVGVLALQGGFDAHARAVDALGHAPVLVRAARDLEALEALVLPGGESSVMLDLLGRDPTLEHALVALASHVPVLATCAGLIVIARRVSDPEQRSLGLLDVDVRRNAHGRQVHSSETRDDSGSLPLVLIRAPRIARVAETVEVLATRDGEPVLVRQGRIVGATFHPELTNDLSIHALALDGTPMATQRMRDSMDAALRGPTSITGPSIADTSKSGVAIATR